MGRGGYDEDPECSSRPLKNVPSEDLPEFWGVLFVRVTARGCREKVYFRMRGGPEGDRSVPNRGFPITSKGFLVSVGFSVTKWGVPLKVSYTEFETLLRFSKVFTNSLTSCNRTRIPKDPLVNLPQRRGNPRIVVRDGNRGVSTHIFFTHT